MILPLDMLIKNNGNMYALSCAVIKRAVQLNIAGGEDVEKNKGKIVSISLKEILSDKIEYQLEE